MLGRMRPAWFKLADPRAYWDRRPLMREDVDTGAHSGSRRAQGLEIFFDEMAREPVGLALDAGCGYGKELKAMHERFPGVRTIGVDFSFRQLQDATRYFPECAGRLVQASLSALPFRDDVFDAAYSHSAVSMIPDTLTQPVIGELSRVTRGRILHREVVREHLLAAGRTQLVEGLDLVPHMFSHDYEAEYRRRGRDVERSEPMAPYRAQTPGPDEEMWYSLIVVGPKVAR